MAALAKILLQTSLVIVQAGSQPLDSDQDSVKRIPFFFLFDQRERDTLSSDSECLRVVHVYKTGFLIQNV